MGIKRGSTVRYLFSESIAMEGVVIGREGRLVRIKTSTGSIHIVDRDFVLGQAEIPEEELERLASLFGLDP